MTKTITLRITSPTGETGEIEGFRSLWAYYVSGYDPDQHCQDCFRGDWVEEFSGGRARAGTTYEFDRMDEFPYLYVCGVARGPESERRHRNLHMALAHAPGEEVSVTTRDGHVVHARDAVLLDIPELPDGWQGLTEDYTRCKNFRFAVSRFGYPPDKREPATPAATS